MLCAQQSGTDPDKLGEEVLIGTGLVDFRKCLKDCARPATSAITIEREISTPQQIIEVRHEKLYLETALARITYIEYSVLAWLKLAPPHHRHVKRSVLRKIARLVLAERNRGLMNTYWTFSDRRRFLGFSLSA